jgi:hypothetical protein
MEPPQLPPATEPLFSTDQMMAVAEKLLLYVEVPVPVLIARDLMLEIARGPASALAMAHLNLAAFAAIWKDMAPIDHNGLRNRAKLAANAQYPLNSAGQTCYAWHTVYLLNLYSMVLVRLFPLFLMLS